MSTVERGLISGETVFDFSGTLERSLRASPDVIATYEDLYASYAEAWSGGDSKECGSAIRPVRT